MHAGERATPARRYTAPLIVVYVTFAVLALGVFLLTTPSRLIAAFSARYLALTLTAAPYLIVAAGLTALFEAYRPAVIAKFPRVIPVLVALAPVFSPVALFASVRVFPDRPEIVIGRVVAGLLGAAVFLVCAGGRGAGGRASDGPRAEKALDTVARVLYDDLRFFLLGAFVFAVLHFVIQAPRPGASPLSMVVAVPLALALGVASGVPNAVLPLAALLVSDRIPPAATVVLLASGAVVPVTALLAYRASITRRVVLGVAAAAVTVVAVAIVWSGLVGSGGGA